MLASVDYEVAIQFPNDTCITPALDTAIGLDVKLYTLPEGSDMAHTVNGTGLFFLEPQNLLPLPYAQRDRTARP